MKPQLFVYQHPAGFSPELLKAVRKRLTRWSDSKPQVHSLNIERTGIVMTTLCDTKTHNKTCRLLCSIADKFVLPTLTL
jgi:hypothetical protein